MRSLADLFPEPSPEQRAISDHINHYVAAQLRRECARLDAETYRYLHACVPIDELTLLVEQRTGGTWTRRVVHVSQLPA